MRTFTYYISYLIVGATRVDRLRRNVKRSKPAFPAGLVGDWRDYVPTLAVKTKGPSTTIAAAAPLGGLTDFDTEAAAPGPSKFKRHQV